MVREKHTRGLCLLDLLMGFNIRKVVQNMRALVMGRENVQEAESRKISV